MDPPLTLFRSCIEAPADVDRFSRRISTLQRGSDLLVFVLFSHSWKITNAVRLARRLAPVRSRSALLCEEEWGADPRNLEPFSGFDCTLLPFESEPISDHIEKTLQTFRSQLNFNSAREASLLDRPNDIVSGEISLDDSTDDADGDDEEEDVIESADAADLLASMGISESGLPSLEDIISETGETDWDPDLDSADEDDDFDIDPGVLAVMQKLAEDEYGSDEAEDDPGAPVRSAGASPKT